MESKLLDKLNKLFALAERSTYPEEAASALAKAQTLMTQHKITKAMLDEHDEEEEAIQTYMNSPLNEEDRGKLKKANWKSTLAFYLTQFNGCHVFTNGPKIIITGRPSNVDTVRYLYKYCIKEIDRLTKRHCRGKGRTYANNFRYGCIKAIHEAMKFEQEELEQQAQRDKKELVVVSKVLQKMREDHLASKHAAHNAFNLGRQSASFRGSTAGRNAGYSAGQSIYNGRRAGALPSPQQKIGY
jgi:hypothetical protein